MTVNEFLEEYEDYEYTLRDLVNFINRDLDTNKKVILRVIFPGGKWDESVVKNPFAFEELRVEVKELRQISKYGLYEFRGIKE